VKLSFAIVGHTHELIDQVFSNVNGYLTKNDVLSLNELEAAVKHSYTMMQCEAYMSREGLGVDDEKAMEPDKVKQFQSVKGLMEDENRSQKDKMQALADLMEEFHKSKQHNKSNKKGRVPMTASSHCVTAHAEVSYVDHVVDFHSFQQQYCEQFCTVHNEILIDLVILIIRTSRIHLLNFKHLIHLHVYAVVS
jgi:hypothetical protein